MLVDAVWQLFRTDQTGEWVLVDNFQGVSRAVERIIAIEALPVRAIFFSFHAPADGQSDAQMFDHLEYTGKHTLYVVKRLLQ